MSKCLIALLALGVLAGVAYSEPDENTAAESKKATASDDAKAADAKKADASEKDPEKIDWKKVDWGKRLTKFQYYIMRQAGTERPFKNKYWDYFKDGEYKCAACGLPLFESTAKFDSECGWPSFDKTVAKNSVTTHKDFKLIEPRIEIRCRRCGSHLGHVFNDGPTETGLRYCMNSAAMKFVPVKDPKGKLAVEKEDAPSSDSASESPKKKESSAEAEDADKADAQS